MKVDYPGFKGGDRSSILLPAVRTELLKALQATGKPVIFVMMTDSAIAIPCEAKNIPASRLPVTFYKSDSDLPDFSNYSMNNRTYHYFKGESLYGFGYGLSYTTFKYDLLKTAATIGTEKYP